MNLNKYLLTTFVTENTLFICFCIYGYAYVYTCILSRSWNTYYVLKILEKKDAEKTIKYWRFTKYYSPMYKGKNSQ